MQFGLHGLEDQLRRPHSSPTQVSEDVIFAIHETQTEEDELGLSKNP